MKNSTRLTSLMIPCCSRRYPAQYAVDFLVWFSHLITLETMQQTQHQITLIQNQDQITIPQTKQEGPLTMTQRDHCFLANRR